MNATSHNPPSAPSSGSGSGREPRERQGNSRNEHRRGRHHHRSRNPNRDSQGQNRDQNRGEAGQGNRGPHRQHARDEGGNRERGRDNRDNRGRHGGRYDARRGRHRHRRHFNGRRSLESVYQKYLNMLDRHNQARRQYFEMYHRADPRQRQKLERHFDQTLIDLRRFEDQLQGAEREYLLQRVNGAKIDLTYSENRQLAGQGDAPPEAPEQIQDPHWLTSQAQAEFASDQEESSGSVEDYLLYKGQAGAR